MTMTAKRDPSLVVIQLTGGNDAMNTVVPYTNGIYQDSRKAICLTEDEVIDLNGKLGLHPNMGPIKSLWDDGKVAIVNGIGYPTPNRSHFRSMDIWHTAETVEIAPNGWLGRTIREIDPEHENVIAGVNFGRGLPRALHCKGVPVASVGNLATYGLLPDITDAPHARACAGHLHAYVRARGWSRRDIGGHRRDGHERVPWRGHIADGAAQVQVVDRVRRQSYRERPSRRGAGDVRRRRDADLLHATRQLRHARRRVGEPRQPDERVGRRPWATSSPTWRSTGARTTRSCWCSPSSVGG